MAVSAGMEGYGSTLAYLSSPSTYTVLGEVRKVDGPSLKGKEIDLSNLGSPNGYMEYKPGMVDPGEFSGELNYVKANVPVLMSLVRVSGTFKLTLPDGGNWVVSGFLKDLGQATPHDDAIRQNFTIKLSSAPVFSLT